VYRIDGGVSPGYNPVDAAENKNGDFMIAAVLKIKLYAPWVHTLKEKRSEVKSLMAKIKNKFNVSVIEAEEQDVHQTIVIGVAALAFASAKANSIKEHILRFVEENSEAEIVAVEMELR
jgi:uncharacterized protein YlxP (DUF503 family)